MACKVVSKLFVCKLVSKLFVFRLVSKLFVCNVVSKLFVCKVVSKLFVYKVVSKLFVCKVVSELFVCKVGSKLFVCKVIGHAVQSHTHFVILKQFPKWFLESIFKYDQTLKFVTFFFYCAISSQEKPWVGKLILKIYKWDKVFKNRLSKICGRQPLKNFTLSVLECFFPNNVIGCGFWRDLNSAWTRNRHQYSIQWKWVNATSSPCSTSTNLLTSPW